MILFPSIEFNASKSTDKYWPLTITFPGTLATGGGGGAVIHDFRLALQADEKERCFSSVCGPNGKVYRFRPPLTVCLTENFSVSVRR
jgi:hypothetical protein